MSVLPELANREVLIGVCGGIAAYKAATLVSRLKQAGAGVSVIMTESATRLVGPKTFQALSGRPVRLTLWEEEGTAHPHIDAARAAEIFCVVPATANMMAKGALGIADDLLSTTLLSFEGPILMAPAMNRAMWEKTAVQRNLRQLKEDGVHFVGPDVGHLSCGQSGIGRMAEPDEIFEAVCGLLKAK